MPSSAISATFLSRACILACLNRRPHHLFGIAPQQNHVDFPRPSRPNKRGIGIEGKHHTGALGTLAPHFMTALAAGLALVRTALGSGKPGSEIQAPNGNRHLLRTVDVYGSKHFRSACSLLPVQKAVTLDSARSRAFELARSRGVGCGPTSGLPIAAIRSE